MCHNFHIIWYHRPTKLVGRRSPRAVANHRELGMNVKRLTFDILLVILVLSAYFSVIIIVVKTDRFSWSSEIGGAKCTLGVLNMNSGIRGSGGSAPCGV